MQNRNVPAWDGIGNNKNRGHLNKLRNLSNEWGLEEVKPEKHYNMSWSKKFDIDMDSLQSGDPDNRPNCCYTDGSKIDGQVGWGYWVKPLQQEAEGYMGRLNNEATVFQAEVKAILEAAKYILNKDELVTKSWDFYCDSQAAIHAIAANTVESTLVEQCIQALNNLGKITKVTIHWIKAHVGHEGNEIVDRWAKNGARGPDYTIEKTPVSQSYLNKIVKQSLIVKWNQLWQLDPTKYNQTKYWFPKIDLGQSEKFIKLDRKIFGQMVQIITGFNYLNYHQNNLGRVPSPTCRFCDAGREDAVHIVNHCPNFQDMRIRVTGNTGATTLQTSQLARLESSLLDLLTPTEV